MYYLYTDGATSNNGYENSYGGWAAVLYKDENKEPINVIQGYIKPATNNICELTAMIEGLKITNSFVALITVVTDSAYIYNCYAQKWYKKWQSNGWINSKCEPVANKELWEQLIPYFENSLYKFEKTKGHADDARNNYVDKLAVAAKENK